MSARRDLSTETSPTIQKKRLSISAIPRPTSGTSRRVTPTRTLTHSQTTPALTPLTCASTKANSTPQTAIRAPPSSWKTPRSPLTRSDSLLPYSQRQEQDLSGVQQQLQLQQYSSRSLSGPEAILPATKRDSPKSSGPTPHTNPIFVSPKAAVVPSRQLLRPPPPPLPRSRTTGDIHSSYSLAASAPSPKGSLISNNSAFHEKVDVIDALRESRMTEAEIHSLNQVQDEAAINKDRQQQVFLARQHKRKFPSPFTRKLGSEATINLSLNDIANTKRLEEQRSKSTNGRSLFINSKLANAHCAETTLPTPQSTTTGSSNCPDEGWDINSRTVYFAEQVPYWIGRYMTICGRLRTADLEKTTKLSWPKSPRLPVLSGEPDFDSRDAKRMSLALWELRSCCQTTEALRSFEVFEAGLRQKAANPDEATSSTSENTKTGEIAKKRWLLGSSKSSLLLPPLEKQTSQTEQAKSDKRRTPAKLIKDPASAVSKGSFLPKSKTTGNLASLVPLTLSRLPLPSISQRLDSGKTTASINGRTSDLPKHSSQTKLNSLRAPEEEVTQPASGTQPRMSEHIAIRPKVEVSKEQQDPQNRTTKTAAAPTKFVKFNAYAELGNGATCAVLESGHPFQPPQPQRNCSDPKPMVEIVNGEKVSRTRIRNERSLSGEYVKNLLGAGFREVKKMGRRVGSMGWSANPEEPNSEGVTGNN